MQVRESRVGLQHAARLARLGYWVWDEVEERMAHCSPEACEILGLDQRDPPLTFGSWMALVHPDDRSCADDLMKEFCGRPGAYDIDYRIVRPDGTERHIRERGEGHSDPACVVRRSVGAVQDITDVKRHEHDLSDAKEAARRADLAKSRFLSAANHDLRQPLQALGLLNANLREIVGGGEARQIVSDMDSALTTAAEILDALLEISELDSGAVKPSVTEFPIDELFGVIHDRMARQAAAVAVELRVLPSGWHVRSDPSLLGRIVENLVANALQHARAGKVLLGCRRRGDRLRIEIWDDGVGVPPAEIEPIFEEYYQIGNPARDLFRGLGLGLAIVRRLATLLDHPLEVSSAMGRHSMFAVAVPLVAPRGRAGADPVRNGAVDV